MTAIQVFAEIAGVTGAAAVLAALMSAETALSAGWNVVMAVSSYLAEARFTWQRQDALGGWLR
jgi:hypothetical protein